MRKTNIWLRLKKNLKSKLQQQPPAARSQLRKIEIISRIGKCSFNHLYSPREKYREKYMFCTFQEFSGCRWKIILNHLNPKISLKKPELQPWSPRRWLKIYDMKAHRCWMKRANISSIGKRQVKDWIQRSFC